MEKKENIVVFPFMAQGHIRPFLALALLIEQKGNYQITFVSTPLNIKNLQPTLPPSSAIRLLEMPFNSSDHGLPPDFENTDSLPYSLILRLLESSSSLKPAFRKILSNLIDDGERPACVIADLFFGWSAEVSHEFGIFHVIFSGAGGFGLACYYSEWMHLWHRNNDTTAVDFVLADFPEAGQFHVSQLPDSMLKADGKDSWSVFQRGNLPLWVKADGVLFNTVEEFDSIGLSYFRRKLGKPVWAIGPILLSINDHHRARLGKMEAIDISPESCVEWLNTKPGSSVLYISFGSQNTISASQMMQLAKALDVSETSFIWVVRPPIGFDINAEFKAEEWLPEGFRDRVTEQRKGLIVEKWAPQLEILSHKSIGAFLSHCGWSSVLESLSCGVPLIGWPMAGEQFFNVKFLEEVVGVCVEVARGTSFGVRSQDLVEKIELVMRSESGKGNEMRKKAIEIEEMVKNAVRAEKGGGFKGSSVKALEEFLDAALIGMREEENVQ